MSSPFQWRHSQILALVFLLAFLRLSFHAGSTGLAADFVDPVSHIAAQDEALYSSTTLAMASGGDWLTPRFLHRFALYKPPLIYWLSGASVKIFGPSAYSLRLPSLLAGALTAVLVFWLAAGASGPMAASCALMMLLADPLWHTLGRLNMTDMPLLGCMTAAAAVLFRNPKLERRGGVVLYGVAAGLALMTKGAAGLMPLLILGIFYLISPEKPELMKIAGVFLVAGAVAIPWHAYQYLVHQRWFWAEYVLTEHVAFGLGAPPQTSHENQAWFYLRRLILMDGPLVAAGLFSVPFWWRRRDVEGAVLFSWLLVVVAAVLTYQYRNISYALPLIPLFCIATAALPNRVQQFLICFSFVVFFLRAGHYDKPAGLDFRTGKMVPSGAVLERYNRMHRPNELILIQADDELFASTLPLPGIRYLYQGAGMPGKYALDFQELGIVMRAAEFNDFPKARSKYAERLRQWGLPDSCALATTILAGNDRELASVVAKHPDSDFLIPSQLRLDASADTFERDILAAGAYTLLLAREPGRDQSCWTREK